MTKTPNQQLIDLCEAIDQFDCPQEIKDKAYELFGITTETIWEHPAKTQYDKLLKMFDDPK